MELITVSKRFKRFAAFIALSALVACQAMPGSIVEAGDRPLELLDLQPEHGIARMWPSAEYVARTEDEWVRVWSEGRAMDPRDEGVPRDGRPVVNFNRYMVIGVSRGYGYSGCHGLYFKNIVERANVIEVQFVHRQPQEEGSNSAQGTGQMCTAMGVFLTRWARVPKLGKPVRFIGE